MLKSRHILKVQIRTQCYLSDHQKKRIQKKKKTEHDVHDVQCNMEMMTIPMILVMSTSNVNRSKAVCSFA